MRFLGLWLILLVAFWSCSPKEFDYCEEAPSVDQSIEVSIERLDRELFALTTSDQVYNFLKKYPGMTQEFLGSPLYPSDSVLAQELFRRISNPYLDTLFNDTQKYFGDLQEIKANLETAFSRLNHYFPGFRPPRVQAMVTGFGSSEMYVSDSLIVIGLDFYLGPKGRYTPPDIPGYILERYQKDYIVPAIMLLYSDKYIQEDPKDNTMLADMVYYGKKYEFAKTMLPCVSDSLIVWYSGDKLTNVEENKDVLWVYFLSHELLYETNHLQKQKYMDERPFIPEIGDQCPGRIGAWIGWDIIKSYKDQFPDKDLESILNQSNAQAIFNASNYHGGL